MRLLSLLIRGMSAAAAAALAAISALTVADVAMANLLNRPIIGVYEIVEICLACVVFLGIAEIFRDQGNITVDVVDHFVGNRFVALLRLTGVVLSLVFLFLMLWAMFGPVADALRFGDRKADTGIPVVAVWAPILLGTIVAIIASAFVLLRVLAGGKERSRQP